MSRGEPWSLLGIAATGDVKAIRRAYAERIKAMDLDADVAGYAALRQARDSALRLAKRLDAAPADDPGAGPETAAGIAETLSQPAPDWPHAAPALPGEWHPDPALSVHPGAGGDRLAGPLAPGFGADCGFGDAIAPPQADPFAAPGLPGHSADGVLGLTPGETPFDRLAALLPLPDAAPSPDMSDDETAEARRRLRAVLDEAALSDIGRHHQIENWLAGLLAEAWPRSAPLLEDATAAFGWEREWGKVDARPAIEYLGARLRGYRFQSKVLQPDHRFHRAWKELGRPGPAGPFKFLRVHRGEVEGLLAGVRKHFPELESHFDPLRVSSWERGSAISPTLATYLIIFAMVILVPILRNLGEDPRPTLASPPIAAEELPDAAENEATISAAVEAAVAENFGAGHDANWLWMHQPDLAQTITANARYSLRQGEQTEAVLRKSIEIVRERIYRDGRLLDGADFETTMRLRLGQLQAARASSASACVQLIGSSWLDARVPVPEALRARERQFAAALAEKGLLTPPEAFAGANARVPGELVQRVIDATGLSEAQVAAAMQGKGSDVDRCAVAVALLKATLDWRGDGRKAILMTL